MLQKISEIEKYYDLEDYDESYLNENNSCGSFFVYDNAINEKCVGSLQKYQMTLHVEGGDGYIPHFHLYYKFGKNVIIRIKLLDVGTFGFSY